MDRRRDAVVDQARTARALLNSAHNQTFTRSLAAAWQMLDEIGMEAFAERARGELRATGRVCE
jgi:hypothetical protein